MSIAAGGGMRHEDIAIALGINVDTLRKWYESELSVVANRRRMEALKGLHKGATRGSSSAAKAYLAALPEVMAPPLPAGDTPATEPAKPAETAKPEEAKLGKKDQAQADAKTAQVGTEWAELLDAPGQPHTVQ